MDADPEALMSRYQQGDLAAATPANPRDKCAAPRGCASTRCGTLIARVSRCCRGQIALLIAAHERFRVGIHGERQLPQSYTFIRCRATQSYAGRRAEKFTRRP